MSGSWSDVRKHAGVIQNLRMYANNSTLCLVFCVPALVLAAISLPLVGCVLGWLAGRSVGLSANRPVGRSSGCLVGSLVGLWVGGLGG